jgi:hypothetical protein
MKQNNKESIGGPGISESAAGKFIVNLFSFSAAVESAMATSERI